MRLFFKFAFDDKAYGSSDAKNTIYCLASSLEISPASALNTVFVAIQGLIFHLKILWRVRGLFEWRISIEVLGAKMD
jgi:hypothetical protein